MSEIVFITPQFKRTDGLKVRPPFQEEFLNLRMYGELHLKGLGLQKWEETPEQIHWLFPYEWYDFIPEGMEIVDINGEREKFKRGTTDNDMRFGVLAYGFIQKTR